MTRLRAGHGQPLTSLCVTWGKAGLWVERPLPARRGSASYISTPPAPSPGRPVHYPGQSVQWPMGQMLKQMPLRNMPWRVK